MNETRIKILEATEVELAELGFAGASIRSITQRAGVNVASINYHFGSKEELIKELFRHRITPLNDLRLQRLRAAQTNYNNQVVPVPELVDIFVRPVVQKMLTRDGCRFVQAMARCMSEPLEFMEKLDCEIFEEVFAAFYNAFKKCQPDQDHTVVLNNLNFVICSMVGIMMHFPRMDRFLGKELGETEFDQVIDQFIQFIAGGVLGATHSPSK